MLNLSNPDIREIMHQFWVHHSTSIETLRNKISNLENKTNLIDQKLDLVINKLDSLSHTS